MIEIVFPHRLVAYPGPAPVGSFAPNLFGLYEMVGNVAQWVEDCYHPNYEDAPMDGSPWISDNCNHRVLRGGNWDDEPDEQRSAARFELATDGEHSPLGFRVARTLLTP